MGRVTRRLPVQATSDSHATSASAGDPAKVTLAAPSASRHNALEWVGWSINGARSTAETLTVHDGTSSGAALFEATLDSTGPGSLAFPPIRGSAGQAMTVRIAGGSSGIRRVNAYGYVTD